MSVNSELHRIRSEFLPFSPPAIGEEEIAEVVDVLRSDWITTGPRVKQFENDFSEYMGGSAALALHSCTGALHTALAALGVGPGTAVITTTMTFCSSVHVIEHLGATPILVDVEPDTLNMDPAAVARVLTGEDARARGLRVVALMPVHLYGHPCDLDALFALAREHGLHVVEDAAHALPAKYKGEMIGSPRPGSLAPEKELVSCFSFYATKNLTTAEGGMLTGSSALVDESRIWSLHGMSRDAYKRYTATGSWFYEVIRPGFKYNMTDIQAALGIHQLRKLPGFQARRRAIVERYQSAFGELAHFQLPVERPEVEHAWHIYPLRVNTDRFAWHEDRPGAVRQHLIEALRARNIGTSVHFIPVHLQPYYREKYHFQPEQFPVAYSAFATLISLPLNVRMSDRDVADVISAVHDTIEQHGA